MESKSINKIFEDYYSNIMDIETVIFSLKDIGLSQMQTTKILIEKLNISLKDADNLVVKSRAWEDKLDDTLSLRSSMFDFLEMKFNNNTSKSDEFE